MLVQSHMVEAILGRKLSEAESANLSLFGNMVGVALAAYRPDKTVPSDVWLAGLDQPTLALVAAEAVALRLRNPEALKAKSVQIDDGRVEKQYVSTSGQMTILPLWLDWLGISPRSQAYSIRPSYS